MRHDALPVILPGSVFFINSNREGSMKSHIVVAGSINMDFVIRTPHHPQIGETVIGGSFQTFPGGKGANQSVAAARAGATVKLIGRVGHDNFGDALIQILIDDQIDTTYIQKDENTSTGVAFIIVDDTTGQNNIVLAEGANGMLTVAHVAEAENAFIDANVFAFNLEVPLPALQHAVRLAQKHSTKIVMNPAPYHPLPDEMLSAIDYIILNQVEASALLGDPSLENNLDGIIAGIGKIQSTGKLKVIVVTLGDRGALIIENGQGIHLPAYTVKAVDTVAAGDAYVGAFSAAIDQGFGLVDAARRGNAAGALAVTRRGAQPSLPTRLEIEQFLANPPE